jgi:LysR family glycine cleavage system transcriptional activator
MWLIPNLGKFNRLYPDIEVAVKTGEQVDDIEKDRRIDLVIRYAIDNDSQHSSTKLVNEKIGMYATENYINSVGSITDACLLETKWYNKNLPEISWRFFVTDRLGMKKTLDIRQYNQEHHVIQAALAGQGIALVSSLLVENAINQGWLVDCKTPEINNKIKGLNYYLLVPDRNLRNSSILAFKEWIKKALES